MDARELMRPHAAFGSRGEAAAYFMDTESLGGEKPATLTRALAVTVRLAHTVASQRNLDAWNEVQDRDSAGHHRARRADFQTRGLPRSL